MRNLGSKNKSEKKGFKFIFHLIQVGWTSVLYQWIDKKTGLLIDTLNVYVPFLVPERLPF